MKDILHQLIRYLPLEVDYINYYYNLYLIGLYYTWVYY